MSDKNASKCKVCREVDGNLIFKPTFKMYANMCMEAYNVCESCIEFLKAEEEQERYLNKIKADGTDEDLEQ